MDQEFNPMNIQPQQNPVEPTQDDGKTLSIVALVCGILGLCVGTIPVVQYFTLVLSVLAIVFGAKGMEKSKAVYGKASGMAVAGLVLGIVSVALTVAALLCVGCVGCLGCIGAAASY